ncbi:hypothetical protein GYH30_021968 [Glycine max]|uniref:Uncharacterized protein n=1 Tax=Glycine max TaxID=3847 RepID=K7L7Z7_SOYBN|nr:hypothetical protein GYH30_021968 [Glycine max]
MASLKSVLSLDSNYNFDELQWVVQIRRTLEEELDEDGEFPVSIFSIPKLLRACDPDSKQSLKLDNIVDQLTKLEQRIRACHHKFLDFNGETSVWMMTVDASFLLEFLQVFYCAIQDGTKVARGKSYHNAILRDIVMLENQIPMFLLRNILEFKFSSLEAVDDTLMLEFISLFKESAHLLDFLYHMIVPNMLERQDTIEVEVQQGDEEKEGNEESNADSSHVKQLFSELWKLLSKLNKGPVNIIKKVLVSKPMKVFVKLPWKIITNFPGAKILKQPVEWLFFSQNEGEILSSIRCSNTLMINKPPSAEEITIPSVTELLNSGVRFLPTIGSISNVSFDAKTCTFYLPIIGLDVNTKVFLKILVAYEASVASGPLVITSYTELMNGIIDSLLKRSFFTMSFYDGGI